MKIADINIESLLYQLTLADGMAEKTCFYICSPLEILESDSNFTERLIVTRNRRLIISFHKSAELVTLWIGISSTLICMTRHHQTLLVYVRVCNTCTYYIQQDTSASVVRQSALRHCKSYYSVR